MSRKLIAGLSVMVAWIHFLQVYVGAGAWKSKPPALHRSSILTASGTVGHWNGCLLLPKERRKWYHPPDRLASPLGLWIGNWLSPAFQQLICYVRTPNYQGSFPGRIVVGKTWAFAIY